MAFLALLASACSATTPPGGREAAGIGGDRGAEREQAEAGTTARDKPDPMPTRQTPASRPLPPGRFVTRADDGQVLEMRVGESRELRVRDPNAPDPEVTGTALELIEVSNIQASGARAWEMRAVRAGRSRIEVKGNDPFVVTVDVATR